MDAQQELVQDTPDTPPLETPTRPRTRRTRAPVRYAVVGLGHIAQSAVLPAFAHAGRNSTLAAIVSGDHDKLTEVGDRYGVTDRFLYEDYALCLERVDAVYIALPNSMHADYAIPAAAAGVHVLCEKPLAVTDEECQRIITACREHGVRLMTAYRLHFERLTLEIIDLVRQGRIGEPRYFSSTFSMDVREGNIRTRPELGGGTLYDLGVYCINAARMLFDSEPEEVFAFSAARPEARVDDTTSAVLRFRGGQLAQFTTSFDAANVSSFRIVGTGGDIRTEPAYSYAQALNYVLTTPDRTTKKRGRKRDQFAPELLYFSDCIRRKREPEPSGDEGAQDVRIIEALYASAATNRPVRLEPYREPSQPGPSQAGDLPPVREPDLVDVEAPHD